MTLPAVPPSLKPKKAKRLPKAKPKKAQLVPRQLRLPKKNSFLWLTLYPRWSHD
jgi:hypothetical protein